MKYINWIVTVVAAVVLLVILSGCAGRPIGVNVWDRDILAKPEMQLDGQGNDHALDDHIYFSKEASSGGRGFGGGGCGCN